MWHVFISEFEYGWKDYAMIFAIMTLGMGSFVAYVIVPNVGLERGLPMGFTMYYLSVVICMMFKAGDVLRSGDREEKRMACMATLPITTGSIALGRLLPILIL